MKKLILATLMSVFLTACGTTQTLQNCDTIYRCNGGQNGNTNGVVGKGLGASSGSTGSVGTPGKGSGESGGKGHGKGDSGGKGKGK